MTRRTLENHSVRVEKDHAGGPGRPLQSRVAVERFARCCSCSVDGGAEVLSQSGPRYPREMVHVGSRMSLTRPPDEAGRSMG